MTVTPEKVPKFFMEVGFVKSLDIMFCTYPFARTPTTWLTDNV